MERRRKSDKISSDKGKAVDFLSDELSVYLKNMKKGYLTRISYRCNEILKNLEDFETYSYQYNIKISGMPPLSERENSESTAGLCLILFHAIGVKYINPGHDITHRVPAHRASNRPNAIICKFVRRLIAKDKVMAARKEVTNLQADQLGFTSQVSTIYQPI